MPYDSRVRPARPDDLHHIVRLFTLSIAYQHLNWEDYTPDMLSDHVRKHSFPQDGHDPDSVHSFVVEDLSSENILGYASVKACTEIIDGDHFSHEVLQIFVPKDAPSQHYGNMLMNYLKKHYRVKGGLYARVFRGHRRFWKNYDFHVVKELQIDENDGLPPAYVMLWTGDSTESPQ